MNIRFHRGAGITFVELLVAMSLMSLFFILGYAVSNSFSGVKKIRNYELAVALATQTIEAARAARYRELGGEKESGKSTLAADFQSGNDPYDVPAGEGFQPIIRLGGVDFKRTVKITECPSLLAGMKSGLKLINVTVQWRASEDGEPITYEAATTLADQW